MDYEAAFRFVVDGIRDGLVSIAARNGAEFVDASVERKAEGAPPFAFRLVPSVPGAAAVEVMPDNADSTYLSLGEGGWIEVFTSPKNPQRGVDDTLEIVEAVVAGRLKERIWRRKKTGERVESLLHIQLQPGSRWGRIGNLNVPVPWVRRWLLADELIEYKPYRP